MLLALSNNARKISLQRKMNEIPITDVILTMLVVIRIRDTTFLQYCNISLETEMNEIPVMDVTWATVAVITYL